MSAVTTSHGAVTADPAFAADVAYYLSLEPRQLPSRYLYDALGSSLFEAICRLPWYGVTRAEKRLLSAHAPDVWRSTRGVSALAELGPGSGEKLAMLLAAAPAGATPIAVHLIDVSASALTQAAQTVGGPNVEVVTWQSDYETGLQRFAERRTTAGRAMVVLLGSNLGNFDQPGRDAFLRAIRSALHPGDALLTGVDLIKPETVLRRAYDDPLGVTAAFNKNLLVRINRELGGDFALEAFSHRAVWNAQDSRIEMHLSSRRTQRIRVAASRLDFTIEAGESIWTESSYKFTSGALTSFLARSGFAVTDQWIDDDDPFALTLASAN